MDFSSSGLCEGVSSTGEGSSSCILNGLSPISREWLDC